MSMTISWYRRSFCCFALLLIRRPGSGSRVWIQDLEDTVYDVQMTA